MEDDMVYVILKLYSVAVERHLKAWATKPSDTGVLIYRSRGCWVLGRSEDWVSKDAAAGVGLALEGPYENRSKANWQGEKVLHGSPKWLLPSCHYKVLFVPFLIYFLFLSLWQITITSIRILFQSKQDSISRLNTLVVIAIKVNSHPWLYPWLHKKHFCIFQKS